ncbi:MAG: alanine dehydrogenase [Deltaproteobacteria bacterium]|jgi:alanine dehydrogenase|nr:alanine dehydrogenase [Deltaproteobacteria bacterium]
MKIGCPKEIKSQEFRVGLIPAAVKAYVERGHQVCVEKGAGLGSGITDEHYEEAGARICATAREVWDSSQMIVKVKEPLAAEYDFMQAGQLLYTYFHFAASEKLTLTCLEKKISAIAYETVQERDGSLPLLKPMSEVAGRMAPLMGAFYLGKTFGGRGLLPTGVPGVAPANILIIGGGTVGSNAAKVAAGLGARVTLLDINLDTLEHLGNVMPPNVSPIYADAYTLDKGLREAEIVIGAVLVTGARAPKIIRREHLHIMKPGSVIVDVAIDQGGCVETSRPTTHSDPVYLVDDIVHYCVANMPGAYARSSTFALNNRTGKYGLRLADMGVETACLNDSALMNGLNIYNGWITFKPVAEAFGLEGSYKPAPEAFGKG